MEQMRPSKPIFIYCQNSEERSLWAYRFRVMGPYEGTNYNVMQFWSKQVMRDEMLKWPLSAPQGAAVWVKGGSVEVAPVLGGIPGEIEALLSPSTAAVLTSVRIACVRKRGPSPRMSEHMQVISQLRARKAS